MAKAKRTKKPPDTKVIDTGLQNILQRCDDGKSYDRLTNKQKAELWERIEEILNKKPIEGDTTNEIISCIDVLHRLISSQDNELNSNHNFVKVLRFINNDVFTSIDGCKDSISKVNEYWMSKVQSTEEIDQMEYFTVKYLMNLCLAEKPLVADIQRLSSIRKAVTCVPFEKTIPSLRPVLIKLAQNQAVLASDHGQRFLAHMLTSSVKLMSDLHKTVALDLCSCTKKKAAHYGKIYVNAWHSASDDMKTQLERLCFQDFMEKFLKIQRVSLDINKNGQNLLSLLGVWHLERVKKHPRFVTMITDCYQPIIWKYLSSGFNVHRCNAADLFFKAFPLQRPGDDVMSSERLFNEQYSTMKTLLTDDCHIVRIIAIREVCNILSHYWNEFSPEQIQNLMSIISKRAAWDASSAEVRRMVFKGFLSLVENASSYDYLKQILPSLADHVHDVNQKVRISFIQLLISMKKKDPSFKYGDIVKLFNLYYQLSEENSTGGHWIVKLLMSNYYRTNMPVIEWTKRFIYLIKTYPHAYRNFFLYSNKVLPFSDAYTIINEILNQLGSYIMSKTMSINQENEEAVEENQPKKRKKSKKPLSDWNGKEKEPEPQKEPAKECVFDELDVVRGLFDIIIILWILQDIKLNLPENEEKKAKLYETYIKFAQPLISYYKDSKIFMSVLSLSSNIPVTLLRNNSITLPGYCVKQLKNIKLDSIENGDEYVVSMLNALVKWGRGNEILEQVSLWLDAAFETKDMNATVLPMRRVKISESQPNSIVAIYILDTLMKTEYVKASIMKKNFKQLFELWKFMSRIQQLIETRLEQGEPFEENLVSDEFLKLCFRRFVKLIPLLKEQTASQDEKKNGKENSEASNNDTETEPTTNIQTEDESVEIPDYQNEMEKVISWAESILYPLLQQKLDQEDVELVVSLLNDVCYVSDNMIIVHYVNSLFFFKVGHFVLKLLSTDYSIYFVKAAARIATALNFTTKQLFNINDDLKIFSTVVPSILSNALCVLTKKKCSNEEIARIERDLPGIKAASSKILATYQDNFKSKTNSKESVRQLQLVVGLYVDSIVTSITHEIPREDMSVPVYSNLSQFPILANPFMTLFHKKKFWGPLFVHVLNTRLSAKEYDCKAVVASILVLHFLAACDKQINQDAIKKALSSASNCLQSYKEDIISNRMSDQIVPGMNNRDSEAVTNTETNKDTWNLDRASDTGTLNVNKRADSETWPSNLATRDSKRTTMASAGAVSTLGDLNEDFIECGLELVKTVDNLFSNTVMEVVEEET